MLDRATVHERWMNNEPLYLDNGPRRQFIAAVVHRYAPSLGSILEIGCNAGMNLKAIEHLGKYRLFGVDISAEAIEVAHKNVTEFIGFHGAIDESIEMISEHHSYDVVFSMATLMHIHPIDEWVFDEIAQIVNGYLITCEWERTDGHYIKARDYGKVFSRHLSQVESAEVMVDGVIGYTLRVFERA